MKSILFSKSNFRLFIHIATALILCSFVLMGTQSLLAQSFDQDQNAAGQSFAQNTSVSKLDDLTTFWSLTKLGGGISLAIFGVLGIGIFLIVIQVYELLRDKIRGRMLLSTNYRQFSVNEVNKLVMKYPNNLTARLYSILLSIFHTTGDTRDFHDEIANYIQMQQDRFGTFKSRLAFLSDTAGALGLLGTVWGMFVTFFGGNLDSQRILNGMGLALVTTLIGLVVSIILNFCSTEVFSIFNKRLELISSKADEFRLWLMAIVQQRNKRMGENSGSGGGTPRPQQPSAQKPKIPAFTLKAVSKLEQDGAIGHPLDEPVAIVVETEDGRRVSGVPIRFEIAQGEGMLENHHKTALVKTDHHGLAKLGWIMGGDVGAQRLKVFISGQDNGHLEFAAFARPFIPDLDSFSTEAPNNRFNKRMLS